MWSAAQSEDQQAELPSRCGRYSFRCGEGRRRCWRRRRRAGATANSRPPPRGGDVGRIRCEKRSIVDDERIRHGSRDRRDVLFATDAAHLSVRAAAGDARLMATLYHVPTSRSLRVLWTLEEIGATVEVKSLGFGQRLEPEYLALNPAGTLPALIDGDRAIYESLAICEYLAARHGSDLIVAPDEPERPDFLQWLLYGEATLQAPLSAMAHVRRIRNTTPEMQAGIDAVLSEARHSLSMRVKLLEQRLEGRDFLVAGRMTLADISVGNPLNMRKPDFASLLSPRATAYRERLLARPAFQRAAAVP